MKGVGIIYLYPARLKFGGLPFTRELVKSEHPRLEIIHLNLPVFVFNPLQDAVAGNITTLLGE